MFDSDFIEYFSFYRLAGRFVDDVDAGFHTTINSAFFFSSSSKKSFSPRLRRASTI
jgi:hypothetical protein